jgi:hypothetical protein
MEAGGQIAARVTLPGTVSRKWTRCGQANVSGQAYTARSCTVTTPGMASRHGSTFLVPWYSATPRVASKPGNRAWSHVTWWYVVASGTATRSTSTSAKWSGRSVNTTYSCPPRRASAPTSSRA